MKYNTKICQSDKNEVQMWAMPQVYLTEWRDNILYTVGLPILEDQSFWDKDKAVS
jgi:hypothetical protein